jgi:hypothetical protein
MLSNYERIGELGVLSVGRDSITESKWEPTATQPAIVIATGAYPSRDNLKQLWNAMVLNDLKRVRFRGVKAIRDVSLGRQKGKGTVGASVQWCFIPPAKDGAIFGLDVAGGARAQETPNLLYTKARGFVPDAGATFSMGGPYYFVKGVWV